MSVEQCFNCGTNEFDGYDDDVLWQYTDYSGYEAALSGSHKAPLTPSDTIDTAFLPRLTPRVQSAMAVFAALDSGNQRYHSNDDSHLDIIPGLADGHFMSTVRNPADGDISDKITSEPPQTLVQSPQAPLPDLEPQTDLQSPPDTNNTVLSNPGCPIQASTISNTRQGGFPESEPSSWSTRGRRVTREDVNYAENSDSLNPSLSSRAMTASRSLRLEPKAEITASFSDEDVPQTKLLQEMTRPKGETRRKRMMIDNRRRQNAVNQGRSRGKKKNVEDSVSGFVREQLTFWNDQRADLEEVFPEHYARIDSFIDLMEEMGAASFETYRSCYRG